MKKSVAIDHIRKALLSAQKARSNFIEAETSVPALRILEPYLFSEYSGKSLGVVPVLNMLVDAADSGVQLDPQVYMNMKWLVDNSPATVALLDLVWGIILEDEIFLEWEPE